VQKAPPSQADWLWDCTTPQAALAGSFVSVSALSFSRKTAATGPFLFQFVRALRIDPAVKGHGFQPCRPAMRRNRHSGFEGSFPQRLKPEALRDANGTPEGVPLQNEKVVGTFQGVPLQGQNDRGTFGRVPFQEQSDRGTFQGVRFQEQKKDGTFQGVPLQNEKNIGAFKGVPSSSTFPSLDLCDGAHPVPHCTTFPASVGVSDVNRH
jgi:hypothetical protein